jgi:hypothetical protein
MRVGSADDLTRGRGRGDSGEWAAEAWLQAVRRRCSPEQDGKQEGAGEHHSRVSHDGLLSMLGMFAAGWAGAEAGSRREILLERSGGLKGDEILRSARA